MSATQTPMAATEAGLRPIPSLLGADHSTGGEHASAHLLEYGDYECALCSEAGLETQHLLDVFGSRLSFTFRHFPLTEHPHAEQAAEAAEAAAAQGKFWPMHHLLLTHWQNLGPEVLTQCAEQAGLDMPAFSAAMNQHTYKQRVQEHRHSGELIGLRASPCFFLDGKVVDVSFGLEHLERAVREAVGEA